MKTDDQTAAARYQEYERQCAEIRQENAQLLKEFAAWMRQQGLSASTLRMHLCNADFYIQEFLLYEQPSRPEEGPSSIGMYLGYWFIRKAPIASPGTIRTSATSLVKFYSFLLGKGLIKAEQLAEMRKTIKSDMAHWQERARRYHDPAISEQAEVWI